MQARSTDASTTGFRGAASRAAGLEPFPTAARAVLRAGGIAFATFAVLTSILFATRPEMVMGLMQEALALGSTR